MTKNKWYKPMLNKENVELLEKSEIKVFNNQAIRNDLLQIYRGSLKINNIKDDVYIKTDDFDEYQKVFREIMIGVFNTDEYADRLYGSKNSSFKTSNTFVKFGQGACDFFGRSIPLWDDKAKLMNQYANELKRKSTESENHFVMY